MLEGEILAAIYSWGCRRVRELKSSKLLKDFVVSGGKKSRRQAKNVLKKLIPYLSCEAAAKDKKIEDPFDREIVENYWLGQHNFEVFRKFTPKMLAKLPDEIKKSVENCRISCGQVKKIKNTGKSVKKITIEYEPLVFGEKISLGKKQKKEISWYPELLPGLKINDWVSVHLGVTRQILSQAQARKLRRNTVSALNTRTKQV